MGLQSALGTRSVGRPVHELPITQSLLDLVLEHAARAGGARVTDVHLKLGTLAGIVADSVQFYWGILTEGTPAAGARLHFLRVPATFACKDCAHEFVAAGEVFDCPGCGSARVRLAAGDDFQLEAIDVEPVVDAHARTEEAHT